MNSLRIFPLGLLLVGIVSLCVDRATAVVRHCGPLSDTTQSSGFQNISVSPLSNFHQVELSISRDPRSDSILLIGLMSQVIMQDSVYCELDIAPTVTLGYYSSHDGGLSWSGGDTLPHSIPGAADPNVAIDRCGRFFYAYDDHWLQKSVDGGISWTVPDTVDDIWTQKDRPHLAIDVNNTNMIAFAWYGPPGKIWLVRSLDSGNTFGARQLLGDEQLGNCSLAHSPKIAFGNEGAMFVSWPFGNGGNQFSCGIRLARSVDCGDSFTTITVPVQGFNYGLQGCLKGPAWTPVYSNGFPVIAVDTTRGTHRGRLYLAWAGIVGRKKLHLTSG